MTKSSLTFILLLLLWLPLLSAVAQDDEPPIQFAEILLPREGEEINGEFLIRIHAFDRRGEGAGIEAIDVVIGDGCNGESILVDQTLEYVTQQRFVRRMALDFPLVRHFLLVRAPQEGAFRFTVCVTSAFTGEQFASLTRTVQITDLNYQRTFFKLTNPQENARVSDSFWVEGFAFDTSGGDELAPGVDQVHVLAGDSCEGELLIEAKPESSLFWHMDYHVLSEKYLPARYEILVPSEVLGGATGAFEFTVCAYSATSGDIIGMERRSVFINQPTATAFTTQRLETGFERPVDLTYPEDDTRRLFVVEQSGRIRIVALGRKVDEPFLDITHLVHPDAPVPFASVGLLSMAFDLNYSENGYFYVYYIDPDLRGILARYQVSEESGAKAAPDSAEIILTIPYGEKTHLGGDILLDADGYLYLSVGDNGMEGLAQDTASPIGSVLRIDVRELPYSAPPENPFYDDPDAMPGMFVYGLRNPWRMSYDDVTNTLWLGDVGFATWEEVNRIDVDDGGGNYGWPFLEGSEALETSLPTLYFAEGMDALRDRQVTDAIPPLYVYEHVDDHCAVIGGYVYRGESLPSLVGEYVFGDYCTGNIYSLAPNNDGEWQAELILHTPNRLSGFGVDYDGELYFLDTLSGEVYQLVGKAE